jgi:hypothetical protein
LRASTEELKEFAAMMFQEVSDRLEEMDRQSRERSRIGAGNQ